MQLFVLNVTYKQPIVLNVIMMSVVRLNVVMLSVLAPISKDETQSSHYGKEEVLQVSALIFLTLTKIRLFQVSDWTIVVKWLCPSKTLDLYS
jgi:hypothetical protein